MLIQRIIQRNVRVSLLYNPTGTRGIKFVRRWWDGITGKALVAAENRDVSLLETFGDLTKHLADGITIEKSHPLVKTAKDAKSLVVSNDQTYLQDIDSMLHDEMKSRKNALAMFGSLSFEERQSAGTEIKLYLRLYLLKLYLSRVQRAISEGEMNASGLGDEQVEKIIDSFLLGSASERLQVHMQLFGSAFDQQQVQDALYILYEPEVSLCKDTYLAIESLDKRHRKRFLKYCKDYLLDVIELNSKARCVFAWADLSVTHIKPLAGDHKFSDAEIILSRRLFFADGAQMANKLMLQYLGTVRLYYYEKKEFRESVRNGLLFFVGTCLLDWLVCII